MARRVTFSSVAPTTHPFGAIELAPPGELSKGNQRMALKIAELEHCFTSKKRRKGRGKGKSKSKKAWYKKNIPNTSFCEEDSFTRRVPRSTSHSKNYRYSSECCQTPTLEHNALETTPQIRRSSSQTHLPSEFNNTTSTIVNIRLDHLWHKGMQLNQTPHLHHETSQDATFISAKRSTRSRPLQTDSHASACQFGSDQRPQ